MYSVEVHPLYYINPFIKILFILSQLVLFLFFFDITVGISILAMLFFIIILNFRLIPYLFFSLLKFSPLFLSIFLLGYLFGNAWQKDIQILILLSVLLLYSLILLKTTSAYIFLSQIKALCGKHCNNSIVFIYGSIRFLPIIFDEYAHTLRLYRSQTSTKLRISSLKELLPLVINRSLLSVRHVQHSIDILFSHSPKSKLRGWDLFLPAAVVLQLSLLLI